MNNLGQIVGESRNPAGFLDSFLYSAGTFQDLGIPHTAEGINDFGKMVGAIDNQAVLIFANSSRSPANTGRDVERRRSRQ